MELQEALQKRRSVRKFTEEAVSNEQIDILMHAAMSGPTACNTQPWEFYIVRNPEKIETLRKASPFTKIQAPMAIVVCGSKRRMLPAGAADYWIQDASAATENILLAVTDLGLGAVWCGIAPIKKSMKTVQAALELPAHILPLNIIYVGHPAVTPEPRDQYDAKKIHFTD